MSKILDTFFFSRNKNKNKNKKTQKQKTKHIPTKKNDNPVTVASPAFCLMALTLPIEQALDLLSFKRDCRYL